MTTALVLTGLPRNFEAASRSIQSNIIERYEIQPEHIFISVWKDRGYWYPGDASVSRSFLEAGEVDSKMISAIYRGAQIDIENFSEFTDVFQRKLDPFPEVFFPSIDHSNYLVRGVNLISMFYKIARGLEMAFAREGITRIIRTRPDIQLQNLGPGTYKNKMVVAKQSNHLGTGIGDNFHAGPRELHSPFLETLKNLDYYFGRTGGILCPHLISQAVFESNSIQYVQKRIKFQTLHTPGGMYKAQNSEGEWVDLRKADYARTQERFSGKVLDAD
jgi:hypothetical protein